DRGRSHAGARFRPDPCRQLDPLLVRRLHHRYRRGLPPLIQMASATSAEIEEKPLNAEDAEDCAADAEHRKTVIPAKAGIHSSVSSQVDRWVPAFAETTVKRIPFRPLRTLCVPSR